MPFTQFDTDLAAGQLPDFAYVVPNLVDDAHDCPGEASSCSQNDKLAAADQWLAAHLPKLLEAPHLSSDGLLIITFDESPRGDNDGGAEATSRRCWSGRGSGADTSSIRSSSARARCA